MARSIGVGKVPNDKQLLHTPTDIEDVEDGDEESDPEVEIDDDEDLEDALSLTDDDYRMRDFLGIPH